MNVLKKALVLTALCAGTVTLSGVARAGHHQWIITEVYSNFDGTVQFVELRGTANGEPNIGGFTVNTLGPEGTVPSAASLAPSFLPPPQGPNTLGLYLLVATAGYATLAAQQGAPAPDRVLPDNFLERTGDRVRYAGIAATDRVFTGGQLPTNGVDSLDFENPTSPTNSPQNSLGAVGTITAAPPPTPAVPIPRWALILLVGLTMGAAGFILRRRAQPVG